MRIGEMEGGRISGDKLVKILILHLQRRQVLHIPVFSSSAIFQS